MNKPTVINLNNHVDALKELAEKPEYKELHRDAMIHWSCEGHVEQMEDSREYDGPFDGWRFTTTDYWEGGRIDSIIAEAAEAGDKDAELVQVVEGIACELAELGFEDVTQTLFDKMQETRLMFGPEDASALFPRHSCHHIGAITYVTAIELFPDVDWVVATHDMHTWVESADGTQVIDFLLFEDPAFEWYARKDKQTYANVEEYLVETEARLQAEEEEEIEKASAEYVADWQAYDNTGEMPARLQEELFGEVCL